MTPAERDLLLTVARVVHHSLTGNYTIDDADDVRAAVDRVEYNDLPSNVISIPHEGKVT